MSHLLVMIAEGAFVGTLIAMSTDEDDHHWRKAFFIMLWCVLVYAEGALK